MSIATIRERWNAASNGKWRKDDRYGSETDVYAGSRLVANCGGLMGNEEGMREQNIANADFVLHSHDDMGHLLDLASAVSAVLAFVKLPPNDEAVQNMASALMRVELGD